MIFLQTGETLVPGGRRYYEGAASREPTSLAARTGPRYLVARLPSDGILADLLTQLRESLAGRYALERELGRGGMASVFLARDLKHDRPVAIKVLAPEFAAALGRERFLREIGISAQLHHPNILPLYDSGSAADHLYYVMPWVEGESLRDRLVRERQLPLADAIRVMRQTADALTYAHSRGVIHRDIKPENILIQSGNAFLADFGIARAFAGAPQAQLTQTGLAIGTAAYMSPEQAAGEPQLDPRSDIYSLACVVYETLAGEPPYTGPTAQAIQARRLTDPMRPVRTVRETVPDEVDEVLRRALARVPADRWRSAADFAQALEAAASPTHARPRRRYGAIGTLAGVALGVLLGVAWLVLRTPVEGERSPRSAQRPANVDPRAFDAYLRGQDQLKRRTQVGLTNAVASFDEAIALDSTFALGWAGRAQALGWARTWDFAIPEVPGDSLLARQLEASDHALALDSTNVEMWLLRAEVAGAIDPTRNGPQLHALRRAIALDSLNPRTWAALGMALEAAMDRDGAAAAMRRAIALGQNPVDLANHYYWWRQFDSAAVWADSAVVMNPRLPWAHETLGAVALARGRPAEAEAAYQAARRLDTGPTAVRSLEGLAEAAAARGDTAAARGYIRQAEAITGSGTLTDHAAIALGSAYAVLDDRERALAWLERFQPRGALHFQMHLKQDLQLDRLRPLPRFQALLSR